MRDPLIDSFGQKVSYPFAAFQFGVEIEVEGVAKRVCDGAFQECDGLEMTMDVKTIREGGNNGSQIRLTGPINHGQITMKRGMTENFELWYWFDLMLSKPSLRANAEVVIFTRDGKTEQARFRLSRCVPTKLKSPPLNAREGAIAIEELQLSYESVSLVKPKREPEQPPPSA
jgi:phage tail-like protein